MDDKGDISAEEVGGNHAELVHSLSIGSGSLVLVLTSMILGFLLRKALIRCKDILIKAEVDRREAEANDGQQQGPGEEFFYLA